MQKTNRRERSKSPKDDLRRFFGVSLQTDRWKIIRDFSRIGFRLQWGVHTSEESIPDAKGIRRTRIAKAKWQCWLLDGETSEQQMNDQPLDQSDNPYLSPRVPSSEPSALAGDRPKTAAVYSSARTMAHVVVLVFLVLMVSSIGAISVEVMLNSIYNDVLAGREVSADWEGQLGNSLQLISIAEVVLSLALMVLFLVWFYKAYKNLPALEASRLEYTPGWAVGGWFVPFLNLVRPYQVAREIWIHSNPATLNQSRLRLTSVGSGPVLVWWLLFIGLRLIDRAMTSVDTTHANLEGVRLVQSLKNDVFGMMIVEVFRLFAAAAAIYMVAKIASWQEQRYDVILNPVPDETPEIQPGY